MTYNIIDIENHLFNEVDKTHLEQFKSEVIGVFHRDDYDFSGVNEIALFIIFDSSGNNEVELIESEYNMDKKEEVSVTLMLTRLGNTIRKHMIDSKFLGINARFYLGVNCTQTLHDRLNGMDTKSNLATMKQQQGEDKASINLKLESPRYKMGQIELDKKTRKSIEETILLMQKQGLIYDEWGFKEVDGIAKTIINFHGKPGTGKTMSAHIIADALDKKIINSL